MQEARLHNVLRAVGVILALTCLVLIAFTLGFRERDQDLAGWIAFLAVQTPFVMLLVAAWKVRCLSIAGAIVVLTVPLAIITTALTYDTLFVTPIPGDDWPPILLYLLLTPFELLFSTWVLAAVILDCRNGSKRP